MHDDEQKYLFFFSTQEPRMWLCSPRDTPLKQDHAARLEERNWAAVSRRRKKLSGSLIDQKKENPVYQGNVKRIA